jgi:hypothetical protein
LVATLGSSTSHTAMGNLKICKSIVRSAASIILTLPRYRLFGRRVRHDRSCTAMNQIWRATLRHGCLHSVRIHRAPPNKIVNGRCVPQGPYIHIIYREEFAEPWMLNFHSKVPREWRAARGFMAMEHYELKVGIMPPKMQTPS